MLAMEQRGKNGTFNLSGPRLEVSFKPFIIEPEPGRVSPSPGPCTDEKLQQKRT